MDPLFVLLGIYFVLFNVFYETYLYSFSLLYSISVYLQYILCKYKIYHNYSFCTFQIFGYHKCRLYKYHCTWDFLIFVNSLGIFPLVEFLGNGSRICWCCCRAFLNGSLSATRVLAAQDFCHHCYFSCLSMKLFCLSLKFMQSCILSYLVSLFQQCCHIFLCKVVHSLVDNTHWYSIKLFIIP